MTHVFFSAGIAGARVGDVLTLDGDEGHHAVKVRRIAVAEAIEVIDGAGTRVSGAVTSVGKQSLQLAVESVELELLPVAPLTVIQALTKKDRSDQVIELLTEVGVDTVIPWRAQRSVMKDVPAKWQRIIVESCKQSRQARFPEVTEVVDTAAALAAARSLVQAGAQLLVCHERAKTAMAQSVRPEAAGYVIVIGPEGGLTDEETAAFTDIGGQLVLMGPSVLRAATAGAVAASIVSAVSRRWARIGGES